MAGLDPPPSSESDQSDVDARAGSGDVDLAEFLTWAQHVTATPTGVSPSMVWFYKQEAGRGSPNAML